MLDVSKLPPLEATDWPRVRDIVIPTDLTHSDASEVAEAHLEQAVCFLGNAGLRRLYNANEADAFQRLLPLFSEVTAQLAAGRKRFRVDFDGLSFRAQLGTNALGHDLTLRVLPDHTPSLTDLRLPAAVRTVFTSRDLLEGGLLLVAAPNGQGKTTTASALIRTRLQAFGGFALTVEDPCELPLQGVWGDGLCIQRPVVPLDEYEAPGDGIYRALIGALRQFPAIPQGTMLMVGEIQDGKTAVETLKAAIHGHLVVATIHARSAADAIRRMVSLCASVQFAMDAETARDLIAAAVRGVWYQRLTWAQRGVGWELGELSGQLLWNQGKGPVAGAIGSGAYDRLTEISARQTEIVRQLGSRPTTAEQVFELLNDTR